MSESIFRNFNRQEANSSRRCVDLSGLDLEKKSRGRGADILSLILSTFLEGFTAGELLKEKVKDKSTKQMTITSIEIFLGGKGATIMAVDYVYPRRISKTSYRRHIVFRLNVIKLKIFSSITEISQEIAIYSVRVMLIETFFWIRTVRFQESCLSLTYIAVDHGCS